MNAKDKARQIYLARLPQNLRKARMGTTEQPTIKVVESGYMRMNRLFENIQGEILDLGIFGEALSVVAAQSWLNRAYQTIVDRSEEITNLPEKQEYTNLATIIQSAIPVSTATEESVEQNLQILRQQIVVGNQDSKTLRKIKMHLITSIGEVLLPPENEQTPEEGGMPPESGEAGGPPPEGEPPGGAPPPPGGAPPPG